MNKYYTLVTYKEGNVLDMISFDSFIEIVEKDIFSSQIDKIKLFKLNKEETGRDLIREYKLGDGDDLISRPDTKVLGYEIVKNSIHSYYFSVKYEMSEEAQKEQELWHRKRYSNYRLKQSKIDDSIGDLIGGALVI